MNDKIASKFRDTGIKARLMYGISLDRKSVV